jgi:hypothetical protein
LSLTGPDLPIKMSVLSCLPLLYRSEVNVGLDF